MSTALTTRTYLSPYKPIPAAVPGWDPARPATWPATTATLIAAGGEAVLVDALMTVVEGEQLGAWIASTGDARLSAVYVTHGHADHFFGATTLLRHRPDTRLLALPDVVPEAAEQASAGYLQVWNGFFPGQVPAAPLIPEPMDGAELTIGGRVVRAVPVGRSDVPTSTVVHIPELDRVVCGDVAYNGIHMWLSGSTPATRAEWATALDAIEALAPKTVVVGHKDSEALDDDAARVLDESRSYLQDFESAVTASGGEPEQIIASMLSTHGRLGNPYTLWVAAHGLADRPASALREREPS